MLLQKNWKENGCWFKLPRGSQSFLFFTPPVRTLLFLTLGGTSVGELQNAPCLQKKSHCLSLSYLSFSMLICSGYTFGNWQPQGVFCDQYYDFAVRLPVLFWFRPSQSCWVLMLILSVFTPQGISSQGLRGWTAYSVLYMWWDSVSVCIPSIGQFLFHLFSKWYVYVFIYFLPTFNGSFASLAHKRSLYWNFF